jgi:hypothetical protein
VGSSCNTLLYKHPFCIDFHREWDVGKRQAMACWSILGLCENNNELSPLRLCLELLT